MLFTTMHIFMFSPLFPVLILKPPLNSTSYEKVIYIGLNDIIKINQLLLQLKLSILIDTLYPNCHQVDIWLSFQIHR